MIEQKEIGRLISTYDLRNITIGALGGHSALDVCRGAKKRGFATLAVCVRGREATYEKYYRSRDGRGVVDDVLLLDAWSGLLDEDVQEKLRARNTVFIHSRYFWVYFDFTDIEERFRVPIYGSRSLLKYEERAVPKNQYYLLEKSGIRMPRIFKRPEDIDRLCIVKAGEAERSYERAFFFARGPESFKTAAGNLIAKHAVTPEAVSRAVIEEYVVGAQVNFNYFRSMMLGELEIMGTDMRRQTNLDGLLRLPAPLQAEVLEHLDLKYIETGHVTCTVKESLLEKAFEAGEKFARTVEEEHPPGIIGPFALQGAITAEKGREELVVFDVSLRIPGSPGTPFTPYTSYLWGESMSYGERIALEISQAIEQGRLAEICT